ncbi:WD40 repeat domain-containing protein, partial [Microvirga sp. 0TCS3.31]
MAILSITSAVAQPSVTASDRPTLVFQKDVSKDVRSIMFSGDGQSLATWDGAAIRLWDVVTGAYLREIETGSRSGTSDKEPDDEEPDDEELDGIGAEDGHRWVTFSRDTATVGVCGDDGVLSAWNASSGAVVDDREPSHSRLAADCSSARPASEVWRASSSGADTERSSSQPDRPYAASPDGKLVLVDGSGGPQLIDAATKSIIRLYPGHSKGTTAAAFSPDGQKVATADSAGVIKIWGVDAKAPTADDWLYSETGNPIMSVAASADRRFLAAGTADGRLLLWDARTRRLVRTIRTGGPARGVSFSPDGELVATAGEGGVTEIFSTATGAERHRLPTAGMACSSFGPDGRTVATAGDIAELWQLPDGRRTLRLVDGYRYDCVSISPTGRFVGVGGRDAAIYDAQTGIRLQGFDRRWVKVSGLNDAGGYTSGSPSMLLFGSDDRRVVSKSEQLIDVWDLSPDGRATPSAVGSEADRLRRLPGLLAENYFGTYHSVAYEPEHGLVAYGFENVYMQIFRNDRVRTLPGYHTIKVMDTEARSVLRNLEIGAEVRALAFADGGATLVSGDASGRVGTWNVATAMPLHTLTAPPRINSTVAVSGNGLVVALASYTTGVVSIWDVASGKLVRYLEEAIPRVTALAFSPDGTMLVCGTDEAHVSFWELSSGRKRHEFTSLAGRTERPPGDRPPNPIRIYEYLYQPKGGVASLSFNGRGNLLAVGSYNNMVEVWRWDGTKAKEAPVAGNLDSTVLTVAFDADDKAVVAVSRSGEAKRWSLKTQAEAVLARPSTELSQSDAAELYAAAVIGRGGKILALASGDAVKVLSRGRTNTTRELKTGLQNAVEWGQGLVIDNEGRLIVGGFGPHVVGWDLDSPGADPAFVLGGEGENVFGIGLRGGTGTVLATKFDGSSTFWKLIGNKSVKIASFYVMGNGNWAIVDEQGRFDAGSLETLQGLAWIYPDALLRGLPPEIFMRDYYEPRILPRLLACHEAEAGGEADACVRAFKPVRPLGELNRVQPAVRIVGVRQGSTPDRALVEVEAGAVEDASQKNNKTRTDVYDLRLFRNGQLVGQWPEPTSSAAGPEDLTAWRAQARVPMSTSATKAVHTFEVRLAARDKGQPVAFTAYAFN